MNFIKLNDPKHLQNSKGVTYFKIQMFEQFLKSSRLSYSDEFIKVGGVELFE